MRILILTPTYPPHQGGVEIATQLTAEELSRRGHRIFIVTSCSSTATQGYEKKGEISIIRFNEPEIYLDPWWSYLFIIKNLHQIKKIIEKNKIELINIVHFDKSFSWTYYLKKYVRVPIISTVHVSWYGDPLYRSWKASFKEPFRRILRLYPGLWFDKRSLLAADYIITISQNLERAIRNFRSYNNIRTLPNAIDLKQFNPYVKPTPITCSGYKILCSGRLSPEKGQIYLIDALKIVRKSVNAHIFLMGSANGNEIKKLKKHVKSLDLDNFVHFIDPKPYREVPQYYKAMDLIVQPSLSESFGIAILENMALGNVVVASSVGGVPELIENGKTGVLVPPADPQKLADAIILTLTDDDLRKEIRKNAIEKAKGYDIENIVGRIEQCYRKYESGIDHSSEKGI